MTSIRVGSIVTVDCSWSCFNAARGVVLDVQESQFGTRAEVMLESGDRVLFSVKSLQTIWEEPSVTELPADEEEP